MKSLMLGLATFILIAQGRAQIKIEVDANTVGPEVNPYMYGIFFEELGHSGDGGLYAELVRNRSFEDCNIPEGMTISNGFAVAKCRDRIPWPPKEPIPGWVTVEKGAAAIHLDKVKLLNSVQTTSLRLEVQASDANGLAGVANTGYWGMSFEEGAKYNLSLYACANPDFKGMVGKPDAPVEIKDAHNYRNAAWFLDNMKQFDGYDRHSPKISIMEMAARSANHTLHSALLEAAYMIGLERNADVVPLVSYAPLLLNVNHKNAWLPVLIHFDNHRVFGTPSYYTQMLFMHHRPDVVLATRVEAGEQPTLFALAGKDRKSGEIIIKIVNLAEEERPVEIAIKNAGALQEAATEWVLTSADPMDQNSFDAPKKVSPVTQPVKITGPTFTRTVPKHSFTVLRLKPGEPP